MYLLHDLILEIWSRWHTILYIDTYGRYHIYEFIIYQYLSLYIHNHRLSLPPVVKNLPANAGDVRNLGSIPGSGRCPVGGHSSPLQYSHLENPIDRGAWQTTVQSWTRLSALAPMHASTTTVRTLKLHHKDPSCDSFMTTPTSLLPFLRCTLKTASLSYF